MSALGCEEMDRRLVVDRFDPPPGVFDLPPDVFGPPPGALDAPPGCLGPVWCFWSTPGCFFGPGFDAFVRVVAKVLGKCKQRLLVAVRERVTQIRVVEAVDLCDGVCVCVCVCVRACARAYVSIHASL